MLLGIFFFFFYSDYLECFISLETLSPFSLSSQLYSGIDKQFKKKKKQQNSQLYLMLEEAAF